MENFSTFTTVKTGHTFVCLTSGKIFVTPLGRGCQCQILKGFSFLRLAVRAKLWVHRPLVRVSSVLDESKPRGQVFVFDGGFFFCFLFSKVLNTFFFPFFSFK